MMDPSRGRLAGIKTHGAQEDPVMVDLGVLFGNPADREGPVALRPRIAPGLPIRRITIRLLFILGECVLVRQFPTDVLRSK